MSTYTATYIVWCSVLFCYLSFLLSHLNLLYIWLNKIFVHDLILHRKTINSMEFFTKSSFSYLSSNTSATISIFPVFFFHTLKVTLSPGILFLITSWRVIPSFNGMPATSVMISPISNQTFRIGELVITSPEVIVKLRLLMISGMIGFVWIPIKARLIVPFFFIEFII